MNGVKHSRQLHPDRSQIAYVEEPAVINLFRRDAPECEPIRLRVEQLIELIETPGLTRFPINLGKRPRNRLPQLRRFRATAAEAALDDFLLPRALGDAPRICLGAPGQMLQSGEDAL